MKHRLQWKFIGIMFISLLAGVTATAGSQYIIFDRIYHMSSEEGEMAFAKQSYLFNLLFILTAIIVFFVLSRRLIKRIERMKQNIAKIEAGQMRDLNVDKHHDELGELAANMNHMAIQIDESLQKEKNMICNLAHDLRTPITSIHGYVELLQKEDLSDTGRQYTDILLRKSDELAEQVSDLLEYSLLTFQEKEYAMEEVSLSSLVEQVLIDFIPMLEKMEIQYLLKGNHKPCMFRCNQNLMVRLYENLLTNSVRYGKQGKQIEIELAEIEDKIIVRVTNYGSLLSEQDREHLFEPLYQGIDAKEYKTESKGLGLSIAKEIVKIHGGTIEVLQERETKKVTFETRFPIVK